METGRPLKFKSAEEMQTAINEYFSKCDAEYRPYTVSGLAVALDTTRRTLLDYEEKDEFSHTIKKAKAKIEAYNEEMLYNKNIPTTGVIFNLKNNYGWQDKQDISAEVNTDLSINIELTDE